MARGGTPPTGPGPGAAPLLDPTGTKGTPVAVPRKRPCSGPGRPASRAAPAGRRRRHTGPGARPGIHPAAKAAPATGGTRPGAGPAHRRRPVQGGKKRPSPQAQGPGDSRRRYASRAHPRHRSRRLPRDRPRPRARPSPQATHGSGNPPRDPRRRRQRPPQTAHAPGPDPPIAAGGTRTRSPPQAAHSPGPRPATGPARSRGPYPPRRAATTLRIPRASSGPPGRGR